MVLQQYHNRRCCNPECSVSARRKFNFDRAQRDLTIRKVVLPDEPNTFISAAAGNRAAPVHFCCVAEGSDNVEQQLKPIVHIELLVAKRESRPWPS